MKLIPTQKFFVARLHNIPTSGTIALPESVQEECYAEVVDVGPDCTFVASGDYVFFLPQNVIAGFDKGVDERVIVPESAVFAKVNFTMAQDGSPIPNN